MTKSQVLLILLCLLSLVLVTHCCRTRLSNLKITNIISLHFSGMEIQGRILSVSARSPTRLQLGCGLDLHRLKAGESTSKLTHVAAPCWPRDGLLRSLSHVLKTGSWLPSEPVMEKESKSPRQMPRSFRT